MQSSMELNGMPEQCGLKRPANSEVGADGDILATRSETMETGQAVQYNN